MAKQTDCLADLIPGLAALRSKVLRRKAIEAGPMPSFGIAYREYLWEVGSEIRVCFLDEDYRGFVEDVLSDTSEDTWTKYGNINFKFGASVSNSDVRVSFRAEPGKYWSLLGSQANSSPGRHTISLGFPPNHPAKDMRRLVLHEFGHSLGLDHEMKNPRSGIVWNDRKAVEYYGSMLPGVSPQDVWAQLQLLANDSRRFLIRDFDAKSIMMYPIRKDLLVSGWQEDMAKWNFELSQSDMDTITEMYPGRSGARPPKPDPEEEETTNGDGYRGDLEVDGDPLKDSLLKTGEVDIYRFTIKTAGAYEIVAKGKAWVALTIKGPGIDSDRAHTVDQTFGAVYSNFFTKGNYEVEVSTSTASPSSRGTYSIRLQRFTG